MRELHAPERFVLAGAVFAATATALALTWNLTPWALSRPVWIALFTAALAGALASARVPRAALRAPRPGAAALLALALALGAAAFLVARDAAVDDQRADAFTQLWARAGANPAEAVASVRNADTRKRSFRVEVERGGRVLHRSAWFSVSPSSTRSVPVPTAGGAVDVVLYRSDEPARPHRSLSLLQEAR